MVGRAVGASHRSSARVYAVLALTPKRISRPAWTALPILAQHCVIPQRGEPHSNFHRAKRPRTRRTRRRRVADVLALKATPADAPRRINAAVDTTDVCQRCSPPKAVPRTPRRKKEQPPTRRATQQ